jgi:2-methylisocitrate lyase-like PEP mutase family enzyme
MTAAATKSAQLRALLASGPVVAPFVFDGLQGRLAERAGFSVLYLTGFGTAASRGLPDLGLLGMSEMVAAVAVVAAATSIPVVADADTGYGGVLNVIRTVRAYEAAGAAGLHIEDQVWPKRCGFFAGKEVIGVNEMVAKVRAAGDARTDPDTVIIARTDALAPHGWDEAERRARAYRAAGADLIFVDGIRTADDLDEYLRRLGDVPLVYNGTAKIIAGTGVALQLHGGSLAAIVGAVADIFQRLAEGQDLPLLAGFGDLLGLLGVDDALATVASYEQGDAATRTTTT